MGRGRNRSTHREKKQTQHRKLATASPRHLSLFKNPFTHTHNMQGTEEKRLQTEGSVHYLQAHVSILSIFVLKRKLNNQFGAQQSAELSPLCSSMTYCFVLQLDIFAWVGSSDLVTCKNLQSKQAFTFWFLRWSYMPFCPLSCVPVAICVINLTVM